MEEVGEKTITLKKSDLWKYSTFLLLAVVVVGAFLMFKGDLGNGGTGSAVIDTGSDADAQEPINAKALIDDNDPILGNADAPVSIIEFSDFQCPFCGRAFEGAIADFKNSDYFKNDEVNLVFKQFPLNSIHPYAQKAGEASLCADEQGRFWEMHDKLFTNQAALTVTDLKLYAKQLGLDATKFNKCLDDGKFASEVSKETAQGTSVGIQGTPGFIIFNTETGDATVISGAYPWANFETAIQSIK